MLASVRVGKFNTMGEKDQTYPEEEHKGLHRRDPCHGAGRVCLELMRLVVVLEDADT